MNDMKNGNGFFDWGDGTTYDGQWVDNQRSGKGTFKYADGDTYIGDWKDDIQDGKGIYKFHNGDIYEGDYSQGERTGEGISAQPAVLNTPDSLWMASVPDRVLSYGRMATSMLAAGKTTCRTVGES